MSLLHAVLLLILPGNMLYKNIEFYFQQEPSLSGLNKRIVSFLFGRNIIFCRDATFSIHSVKSGILSMTNVPKHTLLPPRAIHKSSFVYSNYTKMFFLFGKNQRRRIS